MALRILLLLFAAAFFIAAGTGLAKGKIYCKGMSFERASQPVGFWASVAVFAAFGMMLIYFSFSG